MMNGLWRMQAGSFNPCPAFALETLYTKTRSVMNQDSNPSPDQGFPDETPRPIEASQETPMERQEKKLDEKNKSSNQEGQTPPTSEKTMTDLQQERKAGSRDEEDEARIEGPYGVQEEPEK